MNNTEKIIVSPKQFATMSSKEVCNLPKKKQKSKTNNAPGLEETRHIVHKARGFI